MSDATDLVEAMAAEIYGVSSVGVREWRDAPTATAHECRRFARAALSAISAAGWRLIPEEITDEMRDAMCRRIESLPSSAGRDLITISVEVQEAFHAGRRAAPKVPSP